jgi:hypothetical protein
LAIYQSPPESRAEYRSVQADSPAHGCCARNRSINASSRITVETTLIRLKKLRACECLQVRSKKRAWSAGQKRR